MPSFLRGARKSPRHKLLAATPYKPLRAALPQFAVIPRQLNMEGNEQFGDCVSAEEAWAKAWWSVYCGLPEMLPTEQETIAFARQYGFLDGANLTDVMDVMKTNGMVIGGQTYRDGPYQGVDYSNEANLQAALDPTDGTGGPVKIAIDANALPSGAGNQQGWFATQRGNFPSTDHCVGLGGYGSAGYLFDQLQLPVPSGLTSSTPGYIVYTWATHGFVTHDWLMGTCVESWVRNPTTVGQTPAPSPIPIPPTPIPPNPGPIPVSQNLQLSLNITPPHTINFGTFTLTAAKGEPDMPIFHGVSSPKVGFSLRGLWSFVAEYWGLLKPYLAEYGPVIEQTVVADLLAGKPYPAILIDVAEALIAAGAPDPHLTA